MRPRGGHGIVRAIAEAFVHHNLLTYAAAIAFQAHPRRRRRAAWWRRLGAAVGSAS
jgi:hypothetical protein